MVAYEGGVDGSANNGHVADATFTREEQYQAILDIVRYWWAVGGELFCYYTISQDGNNFGLAPDIASTDLATYPRKRAFATLGLEAPVAAPIPRNLFGVNLNYVSSDSSEVYYADAVKMAEEFSVAVDANGWPTVATFSCNLRSSVAYPGTYRVSFTGYAGSATISGATLTLTYNSGTNTSTGTFTQQSAGAMNALTLSNTRRTGGSGGANTAGNWGVTNLRVMLPGTSDTDLFHPLLVSTLQQFGGTRPKIGNDGVNGTGQDMSTWASRTPPGKPSQIAYSGSAAFGRGPSWEHYVALANATGTDLYLTLPYGLDTNHWTKLAQTILYGSDGTNPYTSAQAFPVWAPLRFDLKLYIEFCNELWNGGFATTNTNMNAATAEYGNGTTTDIYHYANSDPWDRLRMRAARITMEMSNTFRAVWGDGAMGTRCVAVAGHWMANHSYGAGVQLAYINRVYGVGNAFGNTGHAFNYYIHAIAPANYLPDMDNTTMNGVSLPVPTTVDNIFTAWSNNGGGMYADMNDYGTWCRNNGVQFLCYEGGQHLMPSSGGGTFKSTAQSDARMEAALLQNYRQFYGATNSGKFAWYYMASGVGNAYWGLSSSLTNQTGPKWNAARTLATETATSTSTAQTYILSSVASASDAYLAALRIVLPSALTVSESSVTVASSSVPVPLDPIPLAGRYWIRIVNPHQTLKIYIGHTSGSTNTTTSLAIDPGTIWEDTSDSTVPYFALSETGATITVRVKQYAH
jgi:hypothetical protein